MKKYSKGRSRAKFFLRGERKPFLLFPESFMVPVSVKDQEKLFYQENLFASHFILFFGLCFLRRITESCLFLNSFLVYFPMLMCVMPILGSLLINYYYSHAHLNFDFRLKFLKQCSE